MQLIITGGGGFIGSRLALELHRRGTVMLHPETTPRQITQITLADIHIPELVRNGFAAGGPEVRFIEGDVSGRDFVTALLPDEEFAVFHLASVISGDGERDFDLAIRVNLDGTRHLFEACRETGRMPRVVLASSLATFGGHPMKPVVSDTTKQIPQTTYGMTKLIGELMINDYSRKGFFDGRAARLPTIFIRPGKPNSAASSFASSIFREPLNGQDVELPVNREQVVPLLGYTQVVDCFIRLLEVDGELLGDDRSVTLPSTQYTVNEMIATLEQVAGELGITLGTIIDVPDERIRKIVSGWPVGTDATRVPSLGMTSDASLSGVIRQFVEDFMPQRPSA
ncbi:MAG TPA: D-erythronate dehydrogenase [Chthoniobacteraceae bacterium]|jgi:nucleoside-diphosphate-sugar epimerase